MCMPERHFEPKGFLQAMRCVVDLTSHTQPRAIVISDDAKYDIFLIVSLIESQMSKQQRRW
jgi:hypothetical protein